MTDGVLEALGIQPQVGRLFSPADDAPHAPATAILTYGYWQSKFGGDPSVVGRRILLDGHAHEVVGVMPAAFRFLDRQASILVPLRLDPATDASRQLQLHDASDG